MKKERIGELLRWYMREHKRWIWLVILLGVIYGSVFYLYNVPVEAAAYGTVLGVTFLLVMNVLWFWKFCRKHRKRMELIPGIEYAYRDMPEADTLAEKDYQQMVMDLGKSCYEHRVELENQEQESKEYCRRKIPDRTESFWQSCFELNNMRKWHCPTFGWKAVSRIL